MRTGQIDISALNIPPAKHELATAKVFAALGKDVEFIQSSNIKGNHTPDFWMDGKMWEVKSPTGSGKRTIEKLFSEAAKQSEHVIFDLSRCKSSDEPLHLRNIQRETNIRKYFKSVKVITKTGQVLDIK